MKDSPAKKIAIVGSPNVGKSSIFNALSGKYATVSNYPGTTVEVFRAQIHHQGAAYELIDTPGMYGLLPLSEEERVARDIFIEEKPDLIVHVGNARELERTLILTLQLMEMGVPLILVLNMMDEAASAQMHIDTTALSRLLEVPVIPAVCVRNRGIAQLKSAMYAPQYRAAVPRQALPDIIATGRARIMSYLHGSYGVPRNVAALLYLQNDPQIEEMVITQEKTADAEDVADARRAVEGALTHPVEYVVNLAVRDSARHIVHKVLKQRMRVIASRQVFLDRLTLSPVAGLPLLAAFIYFGLYKLVGEVGAGMMVNWIEKNVFENAVNPFFTQLFSRVPYEAVRTLFVGDYGIITLGLRYAVAIILPIVGMFFLVFSIAEDSGYLPRMGALLDRLFKKIGLSGRAVIPMVLGVGCGTMATMVTRILPTKRERIIATLLLSLAIPCSAQLGVIMALLSKRPGAFFIWIATVSAVFTVAGVLLNRILKGDKPMFNLELPPLRMPGIVNILTKTYHRLKWYVSEVIPLFVAASVLIWLGELTGGFKMLVGVLSAVLSAIGLSPKLAAIFLFGFFRRDYGAAGLYDLDKAGLISPRELVVTCVILTLFMPCVAQMLMVLKERGAKMTLAVVGFVTVIAFGVGLILDYVLRLTGMV
jgi:ferrous iron transport protein B